MCPEVEQYHLAPIGIEVELLVVEVRANKLRRSLVNERCCRAGGSRTAC